jgi:hypothetical protein
MTEDGTKVKREVYSRKHKCKKCGVEKYKSEMAYHIRTAHPEIKQIKKLWKWFE